MCTWTAPGTITGLNTNETINGYDLPPGQMSVMTITTSEPAMQPAGFGDGLDTGSLPPPKQLSVLAITAGSGAQFTFNNNNFTYDDAEIDCQMQGGHLASFDTMQEQKDVESFLVDNVGGLCSRSLLLCTVQHAPALVVISLPAAVALVAGALTPRACALARRAS